jgi:hypothetical protein
VFQEAMQALAMARSEQLAPTAQVSELLE